MNLKKSLSLLSVLVLVIFTTAMVSRNTNAYETPIKNTEKKEVLTSKGLSGKGRSFIYRALTKPLAKKYDISLKRRMMSRCPSGLRYYVYESPSEANPYFLGKMRLYSGCRGKIVCEFRVNASEDRVEIFHNKKKKYLSVKRWISDNETLARR